MNPYFSTNIASPEEEEQYVAKFLKILTSLGEHASSYLFQKGVILGDDGFNNYDRQLGDSKFRESIINMLLRPADKDPDKDLYCLVAILLFNMSKEAAQLFLEINAGPTKIGASSGIIALSHLMALIDRATAFLHLPSVNDKAYWRLVTLQPSAPSAARPAPGIKNPQILKPAAAPKAVPPLPEIIPPAVRNAEPSVRAAVQKSVRPSIRPPFSPPEEKPLAAPPTLEVLSAIPELSPIQRPNQSSKPIGVPVSPNQPPSLNAVTPPSKPSASKPTASKHGKKPLEKPKKKAVAAANHVEPVSDSNKPEGPIKAMLRRIAEEIHDNSYEAILDALKDETLMKDLYNSPNNPISVKVTEVNTKERVVYLIKQKRGAPEPVTFRLIRKLVTEFQ